MYWEFRFLKQPLIEVELKGRIQNGSVNERLFVKNCARQLLFEAKIVFEGKYVQTFNFLKQYSLSAGSRGGFGRFMNDNY